MAMCCIAFAGEAPCQCFSPGSNQTTSPGRISSTGPPSRCARPSPNVTIKTWPSGWVCQAVRAPGSNVTVLPAARAGSLTGKSGSIRTVPVNHSAGPFADACEPLRWIFILSPWRSKLDHYLDRFAVVHRAVAVGHAVEIRDAVEYFARLDSSL